MCVCVYVGMRKAMRPCKFGKAVQGATGSFSFCSGRGSCAMGCISSYTSTCPSPSPLRSPTIPHRL